MDKAQSEGGNRQAAPLSQPQEKIKPWAALEFRDFRILWASVLVSSIGLQMRQFANVWQVYEISHSPFQLGLTGLFQALPLFTLGLFAGTLADRLDRRMLLITSQVANLAVALALGLLTAAGVIQVWHIYIMTAITSSINIFGQPARVALVSSLVPRARLLNAITLVTTINQVSMLVGPSLAGLVVAQFGASWAYFINAIAFIISIGYLLRMRATAVVTEQSDIKGWKGSLEGLRFVWETRIILALILLDTVATLFGAYRVLMPVFAKDILKVGPKELGLLFSAPAVGSLIGSITVLLTGNIQRKGLLIISSTFFYALSIMGFGLSKWFVLSLALAASLGFLDSLGVSARQTTLQILSPDHLRGRTTSVMLVFAMGSPSLGYIMVGTLAAALSAPTALFLGGLICAAISISVAVAWREVRDHKS